jgi:hypothetical protein
MDKQHILKEIETLIRSIKVHYDNLDNEPRIPTIELELITSKIRKLHEKSIIYNHLHYIEEEQIMQMRKNRSRIASSLDLMDKADAAAQKQINTIISKSLDEIIEPIQPVIEKSEEPVLPARNEVIPPVESIPAAQPVRPNAEAVVNPISIKGVEETPVNKPADTAPPAADFYDFKKHIGLNNRIWFVKELFKGSMNDFDECLTGLGNCTSDTEAAKLVNEYTVRFSWDENGEAFENLQSLIRMRFKI